MSGHFPVQSVGNGSLGCMFPCSRIEAILDCLHVWSSDLLRRHAELHTRDEPYGKRRRVKASHACMACVAVKAKCNDEKPCARCKSSGLDCILPNQTTSPTSGSNTLDILPDSSDQQSIQDSCQIPDQQAQQTAGPNFLEASYTANTGSAVPLSDDPSLTDFLREVFHPAPPALGNTDAQLHTSISYDGDPVASWDVMDFSQDLSLEFQDIDGALAGEWGVWTTPALDVPFHEKPTERQSDVSSPSIDESISLSSAAFQRSAWRWVPNHEKGNQTLMNLGTAAEKDRHDSQFSQRQQRCLLRPMDSTARDRIVAMLLTVCEKANYQNIAQLLPSPSTLQAFADDFLFSVQCSIDDWIHLPTFLPSGCMPELLAGMISAGAVASSTARAQKFGYALHESTRLALPIMFERDNSNTRCLQALQALAINLDVGVWSGNKRLTEIAESHALLLITMLRRADRFRRPRTVLRRPELDDDRRTLEQKWRQWVDAESFKRLAYHVFAHSVHVSIAFRTPPLVSFAEITLDLPAPQELWEASNAVEWRDRYLALGIGTNAPNFVQSMYDARGLGVIRHQVSLDFVLYLVQMGHWCLTWAFVQLNAAAKAQPSDSLEWAGSLLASPQPLEIRRLLDNFRAEIDSWNIAVPDEVLVVDHILRLNLVVEFEDLQLLAGKEGEDEARKVLPKLRNWFEHQDSREAVSHAGQIVKLARQAVQRESLVRAQRLWMRDFNAVALLHAALVFWVYGLLSHTKASEEVNETMSNSHSQPTLISKCEKAERRPSNYSVDEVFAVDGDDAPGSKRHLFIRVGRGIPAITSGPEERHVVPLLAIKSVLDTVIDIMKKPYDTSQGSETEGASQSPSMVANLIQLMHELAEAASAI